MTEPSQRWHLFEPCLSPCLESLPCQIKLHFNDGCSVLKASQSKSYSAGLERKLRSNQQYLANLESRLQHEIVKAAPLMGSNLDALPTAQLQQLVHAQEEALKRARSMLVSIACAACTCLHSQTELWCHKQSGHYLQVLCIIMRSCMLQQFNLLL